MRTQQTNGLAINTESQADLPAGYRLTELGPLPEEWRVVRLGEVAKYINGHAFKPMQWSNRGRPIIRIQNLTGSSSETNYYSGELDQRYLVRPGDLLMSWSASLDVFIWAGPEAWLNQHIFKVSNFRNVDKGFLFYSMKAVIGVIRGKTRGTTMKHVTRKEFVATAIPLPPLPEQRAIAHVLRAVQEAKEATERVITAARELKKSLMRHLFTYGPVPVDQTDQVPLKETEIGPIPAHWQVVRLGEVVSLQTGIISPADFPDARYVGLEHLDSGEIFIQRYGIASETKSAKAVFQQGDILYGKLRPYLDKAAVAEWEGVCSTDILVLRGKPKGIDTYFLAYLMHSIHILSHAIATTTGVNHPRTSWKALSQAVIPLPPLPEQQEIARILQTVDEKIRAEQVRKQALEVLFRTLLDNLMTGRIRVKDIIASPRSHLIEKQVEDPPLLRAGRKSQKRKVIKKKGGKTYGHVSIC